MPLILQTKICYYSQSLMKLGLSVGVMPDLCFSVRSMVQAHLFLIFIVNVLKCFCSVPVPLYASQFEKRH